MTETLSPSLPQELEAQVERVLHRASALGLSLVTAESCTGGLLASLLTDVDGMAHAFDRGFVVYSRESKTELLGVPAELIDLCGAVSAPVARAMAEGALVHSHGDLAVAVTGYAGPAGPGAPEGLTHFAAARRNGPTRCAVRRFGKVGRGQARVAALGVALEMLETVLAGGPEPQG